MYAVNIGGTRHTFPDLKFLLARASPLRSGDQLAGVAAETAEERVAAQMALADVPLTAFLTDVVVKADAHSSSASAGSGCLPARNVQA